MLGAKLQVLNFVIQFPYIVLQNYLPLLLCLRINLLVVLKEML